MTLEMMLGISFCQIYASELIRLLFGENFIYDAELLTWYWSFTRQHLAFLELDASDVQRTPFESASIEHLRHKKMNVQCPEKSNTHYVVTHERTNLNKP